MGDKIFITAGDKSLKRSEGERLRIGIGVCENCMGENKIRLVLDMVDDLDKDGEEFIDINGVLDGVVEADEDGVGRVDEDGVVEADEDGVVEADEVVEGHSSLLGDDTEHSGKHIYAI